MLSVLLYRPKGGRRLFLYTALYFVFTFLIEINIHGTETTSPLTVFLQQLFDTATLPRTFSYFGAAVMMILLLYGYLRRPLTFFTAFLVFGLLVWSIFMLMSRERTAFTAWLYILPYQCFTLILSLWGLSVMRGRDDLAYAQTARLLMRVTAVFSVVIFAEDSVKAFLLDDISIRNYAENLLHAFYAAIFICKAFNFIASALPDRERQPARREALAAPDSGVKSFPESGGADSGLPGEIAGEDACAPRDAAEPSRENLAGSPEGASVTVTVTEAEDGGEADRLERFALYLGLTQREREVLTLLLSNRSNQQICEQLHISIGTAKAHSHNIFQKAGAANRSSLLEAYRIWSLPSE